MNKNPITVLTTPCIEWTGYKTKDGYGQKHHEGKVVYVHRLAYCGHHGIALDSIANQVVRHDCDNPACINPVHMQIGTRTDNSADRVKRGRHLLNIRKGEKSPAAKLTKAQVSEIRSSCVPGCSERGQSALARKFGVSSGQVCRVFNEKLWVETA